MFGRSPDAHSQASAVLRDMAVKARERNAREARVSGFPVDGARYVLYEMSLTRTTCVAIRDSQVEHYEKDSGSIFDNSWERTVIPFASLGEVTVESSGADSVLTLSGERGPVSIKTRAHEVEYAVELLEELRAATHPAPAPPVASPEGKLPPVEALTQLTAMHEGGLVSDEEFASKRAEILDRL